MSKLARDAAAFAMRVKMGSHRLWLFVEGRNHDRAFYDRLLGGHVGAAAGGYAVRLVEQIELNGVAGGGKPFAQSLFDYFDHAGLLRQQNSKGDRLIAFALDVDFDALSQACIDSDHVIYTRSMDVEAEVLVNGDLRRAVCSAYSLPSQAVSQIIPDGRQLASELALRWRRWIGHGAVAACCGVETGMRFSKVSKINEGGFGPLKPPEADKLENDLASRMDGSEAVPMGEAQARVDAVFDANEEWTLVKGKWLARFVAHLIEDQLSGTPLAHVPPDTISKTCLETLDFSAPWSHWYHSRVDTLLAA